MAKTKQITVVGGGVIGLACAWRLAQKGYEIRLIDAGQLGRGSSWAGGGILPAAPKTIVTDPIDLLRSYSHERYPAWAVELQQITDIDIELRTGGGVYLARTRGEAATLVAQQNWWEEHEIDFERWSLTRLRAASDHLTSLADQMEHVGMTDPVWYLPEELRVRNPRLVHALVKACEIAGVGLIEHQKVIGVEQVGERCKVRTDQRLWECDQVCIASGAWTQLLLERFGVQTGILPVRGQMLLYKLPSRPFSFVLNDSHRYLVPRDDGHVLAGSCEEEVGFACETTDVMVDELKSWVADLLPTWNDKYFVQAWAGLRPGSFDSLPYIGRLPNMPRVSIAAGHFRSGLHLMPATADAIVALIEGASPPFDLTAFHINRGLTASSNW